MNFEQKKVLVVGTGISGIGAAALLAKKGALPILFDGNETLTKEEIYEKLPKDLEIEIAIGSLTKEQEEKTQLVVLSPGVPTDTEFVDSFRSRGIKIWGEIELAYAFEQGKVLAITGTNGKTTTTSLLGQIMKDYVSNVFVVGNIGNPYTLEVTKTTVDSVTVAEISSFQLETIESFHPAVTAILNITPDHLNRHHTMENYVAVKEAIAKNQTKADTCVLNYEDPYTQEFGQKTTAQVVYFSSARKLEKGIYLENEEIVMTDKNGTPVHLMNIHEMQLLGTHNVENVMAAIAMADAYGVPMKNILETVKVFKAVEHRIEYVATKKGVMYYNDSKGTNPDAAIKGIQAMNRPTILIGGGYDKNNDYDEWIDSFDGKVKWLVLIGQTKEKIAACARQHGFQDIIMAETFEEAMDICIHKAQSGDAVLLSPACASWGMFPNYEVRGKIFKDIVNKLED